MLSLKDRLLRAGFSLMVLSAGWTSPVAAEQERVNPPAFSYLLHCSGCHIEDGSGDPPEVPDLRKNLDKLLKSATGRGYMLRVPGVTDTPITPQEMADLMNWLITEFYPELEDFRLISAAEVTRGRATRLANPLEVRQTLLGAAKD
ncbi:MAG: c-type cytochrome [Pseudohongiellaceae bacterium]